MLGQLPIEKYRRAVVQLQLCTCFKVSGAQDLSALAAASAPMKVFDSRYFSFHVLTNSDSISTARKNEERLQLEDEHVFLQRWGLCLFTRVNNRYM